MNKVVSKIATRLVVAVVAGLSALSFGACNFSTKGASAEQVARKGISLPFIFLPLPIKKRSMLLFFSFMAVRGHRAISLLWPMIAVSLPSVVTLLLP